MKKYKILCFDSNNNPLITKKPERPVFYIPYTTGIRKAREYVNDYSLFLTGKCCKLSYSKNVKGFFAVSDHYEFFVMEA